MWHGGGWFMAMRAGDQKPKLTRELLGRVLAYRAPLLEGYHWDVGDDSDHHRHQPDLTAYLPQDD